jgi:hypothetical protein
MGVAPRPASGSRNVVADEVLSLAQCRRQRLAGSIASPSRIVCIDLGYGVQHFLALSSLIGYQEITSHWSELALP